MEEIKEEQSFLDSTKNFDEEKKHSETVIIKNEDVKSQHKSLNQDIESVHDKNENTNIDKQDNSNLQNQKLQETDQADVMQSQEKVKNKEPKISTNNLNVPQNDDDVVPRSVTVVEHEHGFKSQVLNMKHSEPSSASSNRDKELMMSGSDKSSLVQMSEKSKPLSPLTSQRLSPKEPVFDYVPKNKEINDSTQKSKNSVKFKEVEESEVEGVQPPENEPEPTPTLKNEGKGGTLGNGQKNSSTKITSILKNSNKDKNSVAHNDSEDLNAHLENSLENESEEVHLRESKDTQKNTKKRDKIPNMKVEEDQVNLSDLGNGPDKPTIKTIVKKFMKKKDDKEPTPSIVSSKHTKSPGSKKGKASKKSTKSKEENSEEDENSDGISEYSEVLDDSQYLEYEMQSELFDFAELSKDELFKVKRYKDAIYRGQVDPKTGLRQGMGVMEYENGRVYEGSWKADLRNGQGFEKYANGNHYSGHFLDGKAHGQGYYKWANGEFYNGEWNQGQKDGYGEWQSHEGETYIGDWKKGVADGNGCYTWSNGDKYDGEWLKCLKHGKGHDLFANGDSYTGQYRYGKPWGIGVYQWKNGSMYQGQFKNGLKHGKGKWSKGKGEEKCTFEGNYIKGKKEGYGEFKWASGNFYRGEYKDDERHGYGEMYWVDGS